MSNAEPRQNSDDEPVQGCTERWPVVRRPFWADRGNSMSQVFSLEPDEFAARSSAFGTAGDELAAALRRLEASINSEGRCWGNDPPGQEFEKTYQPDADTAVQMVYTLIAGMRNTETAMQRTATDFRYQDVELGRYVQHAEMIGPQGNPLSAGRPNSGDEATWHVIPVRDGEAVPLERLLSSHTGAVQTISDPEAGTRASGTGTSSTQEHPNGAVGPAHRTGQQRAESAEAVGRPAAAPGGRDRSPGHAEPDPGGGALPAVSTGMSIWGVSSAGDVVRTDGPTAAYPPDTRYRAEGGPGLSGRGPVAGAAGSVSAPESDRQMPRSPWPAPPEQRRRAHRNDRKRRPDVAPALLDREGPGYPRVSGATVWAAHDTPWSRRSMPVASPARSAARGKETPHGAAELG